jgi:Periplasmic binding protein-like domain
MDRGGAWPPCPMSPPFLRRQRPVGPRGTACPPRGAPRRAGDVSLVGYDGIPEAEYAWPPLTTVRQDFGEAGRRALELLVAQIEGEPRTGTSVALEPELVVRDSSGPPPSLRSRNQRIFRDYQHAHPGDATRCTQLEQAIVAAGTGPVSEPFQPDQQAATTQTGSTRRPPFGVGRRSAVPSADAGHSPTLISADGRS